MTTSELVAMVEYSMEAIALGVCLNCGYPVEMRTHSDAGREEYQLSGICEDCYDSIMSGGE